MSYQVHELLLENGASPYADWFDALPAQVAARVATALLRMQQGNLSNVAWFRGIGEYKLDFGAGWRIYLARDGAQVSKKGRQNDIERAIALWEDYKRRKAAAKPRRG